MRGCARGPGGRGGEHAADRGGRARPGRPSLRAGGARARGGAGGPPRGGVAALRDEPVLARAGATRGAELLDGAAAPAQQALGLESPDPGAVVAEGPAVLHALYWLTVNLAAGRPLVLAVDDAHWADVSSLRALD